MTKQNQQQKNLNDFRKNIDEIDQKILQLLEERMQIVKEVANFKAESGENFFIKSAREADMIKDLIKQSQDFSPCAILKIWRAIITSANLLEQPVKALIFNPKNIADFKYLVRSYYLDILPILEFENLDDLTLEIAKNPAQIAVFAASNDENEEQEKWWLNLANNKLALKIFAKIPFLKDKKSNHELFLAAIKEPEKSSSDNSLLVVEINKNFSQNDLINSFENCKISAKILDNFSSKNNQNNFYLVDAEGFVDFDDEKLINFCQEKIAPIVKIIGYYPR